MVGSRGGSGKNLLPVHLAQGIDWDTSLDGLNSQLWEDFRKDLLQLAEIRVPRHVPTGPLAVFVEWYGFADASERAYAGMVYLQMTSGTEGNQVSLISAKIKVAPIKQSSASTAVMCRH